MKNQNVIVFSIKFNLHFERTDICVSFILLKMNIFSILAKAFELIFKMKYQRREIQMFVANLANIDKALKSKIKTNSRIKFSTHYYDYFKVFDSKKADKLSLMRKREVDYSIKLKLDEDKK